MRGFLLGLFFFFSFSRKKRGADGLLFFLLLSCNTQKMPPARAVLRLQHLIDVLDVQVVLRHQTDQRTQLAATLKQSFHAGQYQAVWRKEQLEHCSYLRWDEESSPLHLSIPILGESFWQITVGNDCELPSRGPAMSCSPRCVATPAGVLHFEGATAESSQESSHENESEEGSPRTVPRTVPPRFRVLVVGCGVSGLAVCAALRTLCGDTVEVVACDAALALGSAGSLRSHRLELAGAGLDCALEVDVGALALSFDASLAAQAAALRTVASALPSTLRHADDGLLSYGALSRTLERPQGWNAATGRWEHFVAPSEPPGDERERERELEEKRPAACWFPEM